MNIKNIIGDYETFIGDLISQLDRLSIHINDMSISHINYRVETDSQYENMRDLLKTFCKEFVETQFNGRAVSILQLKNPLHVSKSHSIPIIELPAPRSVHTYLRGLEHLGLVVGKDLPEFKLKYQNILTGEKDRRPYCFPAFITFSDGKTAKFYDRSLKDVVLMQGWAFEKL